ncbi:hypothetical protein ABZ942_10855 [Nocardia sp. NPDC046473]|uniref:hypothetical protein n=1 Tax=Nocardia sp. NPDC046473 TaxID=3155733 RepID=UPI0034014AA9
MTRIRLAALLVLVAFGTVAAGSSAVAFPVIVVAEQVRPEGRFSVEVHATVLPTGVTYNVEGAGWAHDATVHIYVAGWSRLPTTRSWGQADTDAHGNFHFSRFEPYIAGEEGQLELSVVDPDTGHRSKTPIQHP